ncbi:MAG: hypothetical protein AAGI15_09810 [Pseudomonadota bacterium]
MNATTDHPLEHQVSDYLNGHLDAAARRAFEQALAQDPALAELVRFDRALQRQLKAATPVATSSGAGAGFEAVRARIEPQGDHTRRRDDGRGGWFAWGLPVAAAVTLSVLLLPALLPQQVADEGEYETLTDKTAAGTVAITIIAANGVPAAGLEALAQEVGLPVDARLPGAIRVSVAQGADLEALRQTLEADPRVRLVRVPTQ